MVGEAETSAMTGRNRPKLRRRSRWVILTTLASMVVSSAFVFIVPPRYAGVANVVLEEKDDESGAAIDDPAIRSDTKADLARKPMGLAANPEFLGGAGADRGISDAFLAQLTVSRPPGSRVLRIEFDSGDPVLAARGAEAAAEIYVRARKEAKTESAHAGTQRLSQRIEALKGKVADAEAKLASFLTESNLHSSANGETSAEQIPGLDVELAIARSAEADATAKAELLRRLSGEGRLEEAPSSIADETVRRLLGERATLRAEIADASRTLRPLRPQMQELAARLTDLDAELRAAAAKNLIALENDSQLAKDRVASLDATFASRALAVAAGDGDGARWRALVVEARDARDELELYQQKFREAEARESDSAASDESVIATGAPQRESVLPPWQTIVLVTLAGFGISSAVAAAAPSAAAESRMAGGETAMAPLPRTVAAIASTNPVERERAGQGDAEKRHRFVTFASQASRESPEELADRLNRSKANERLVILVTGHGSGQSLSAALETARRFSSEDVTLLVDLGAAQDWFGDIVGREDGDPLEIPGLVDLLGGRASIGDLIRRDLSTNLDVIRSGGDVGRKALDDVFAALASSYDRLVFHASDLRAPAAGAAARIADAVVVVAPAARLRLALQEARQTLGAAGPDIIGLAERRREAALEMIC